MNISGNLSLNEDKKTKDIQRKEVPKENWFDSFKSLIKTGEENTLYRIKTLNLPSKQKRIKPFTDYQTVPQSIF